MSLRKTVLMVRQHWVDRSVPSESDIQTVGLALAENETVTVKVLDTASALEDGGGFTGEIATIKKVRDVGEDLVNTRCRVRS